MERKVFYNHRPIRISYIFDDSISAEQLKKVIFYNLNCWWWRYFQFFKLVNNDWIQSLSENDLQRMYCYDSDVFVCLCDIDKHLADYITIKFSPLEIVLAETYEVENKSFYLKDYSPVTTMPCKNLVSKISSRNPKIVNFLVDESLPEHLKDIIALNFWLWNNYGHYNHYLNEVEHIDYKITTDDDIINYFNKIDHSFYLYLNQLSTVPYQQVWTFDQKTEIIYLIIGTSVKDYTNYWNRNINYWIWKSNFLKTFILPLWSITDEASKKLISAFINFLIQYRQKQVQNNYFPDIVIVSNTFTKEELESIPTNWFSFKAQEDIDIYTWSDFRVYFKDDTDCLKYASLYQDQGIVRMDKEELWHTGYANEQYMTDICIEYDKSGNVIDYDWHYKSKYLQLNRNNNVLQCIVMWRRARVNSARFISVLFDKSERESWAIRWQYNDNRFELKIKIPSMSDIIRWAFLLPLSWDLFQRNFFDIKKSNDWKKCSAIINLFNWDLSFLKNMLDDEKLRNLIIRYAQVFNKESIEETIKKIIVNRSSKDEDDQISQKIYNQCFKNASIPDKYVSLKTLKEEIITKDTDQKYIIEELNSNLNDLIDIWLLRQWVEFKCWFCSEKYWLSIWQLNDINICRWCWNNVRYNYTREVCFSFNSIIKWSDAKWVFAVLHYLTMLFDYGNNSFVYWLWVECIKDETIWSVTDCDIACLKNWKLLICEVKYNRNLFKEDDFNKLKVIWEIVKPDAIHFASYWKPTPGIEKNIEKRKNSLQSDLSKYWISVFVNTISSLAYLD